VEKSSYRIIPALRISQLHRPGSIVIGYLLSTVVMNLSRFNMQARLSGIQFQREST
jgi:hypothetical protein